MYEQYAHTHEFATIAMIAETIRGELGDEVEACPGFARPEQAEPLNRLFRALVRRFLEHIVESGDDPARLTSWVIRELAHRHLTDGGLDAHRIKTVLELESGTPDDWLTYLLLVPWTEVIYWLTADDEKPG
jgi:hypothetical protein